MNLLNLLLILLGIILGVVVGYFVARNLLHQKQLQARQTADDIIKQGQKEADNIKKEKLLEAKEENQIIREQTESELRERRGELQRQEARLLQKEENLDRKSDLLDKKDEILEQKESKLEERQQQVDAKESSVQTLIMKHEQELERISGLTQEEAVNEQLQRVEEELSQDIAVLVKEKEKEAKEKVDKKAKELLATTVQRLAADHTTESTVSVVNLPNDEMKGRIIGREGRNIRTIEALTGVDVIIDDTPEAVVLSCFDGVKREIARLTIEKLITDGRIHPGKIEEIVNKCKKEIEKEIIAAGEGALIELSIPSMHPEIIKTLGRLKYRTSYGQNVLTHSIEVAKIASTMAAEIGANVELAKRGGVLHDIGKVLVNEIETSHAIVGGEFIKRFGEKQSVINAVMAHHNEVEFETVEAILVQAADAVSASRPGARRETLTAYIKRLENLEEIANSFEGVESSYAIQAGRELRIVINPDKISDDEATLMSREVAKKIEDTMQYPGQIKVTILRETRAVEYAK